ncbi:MAG TPA: YkuS family protein [Bacillota bacterium]|jgi:hypothetical protein|nr:YkuS family protein [Bacillota bacterium]HOL09975.1 YkuS family protein [Bacillota bacterium]HPO97974.1 YkuS family protein [Bacillota bacterium]
MKKKVAVESDLPNVSKYLAKMGYEIEEYQYNQEHQRIFSNVDAIVTSGINETYLGINDFKDPLPIVNASGLSLEQIASMLEERL